MAFSEMILIFRDPPPPSLIPSMIESGALSAVVPVFDRAFQIGADCSPSELRHRLKTHTAGLPYACGSLKHETFLIDCGAE